jgi:tetratricopeptide (TPR) repeat protein
MNSAEILRLLKNPSLLNESSLTVLEKMVVDYPWFPAGWILYVKNLKNLNHADYHAALSKAALRVSDRKWFKRFLESDIQAERLNRNPMNRDFNLTDYLGVAAESDGTGQTVTSEKSKLIESFLAKGATFHPFSPGENSNAFPDLSEEAVRENDDIVTETYANLLCRQSKYEKAIRAFEKLSLKYPEKSIYFAARVEEIKKVMDYK